MSLSRSTRAALYAALPLAALLSSPLAAQPVSGLYIGGGGGLNLTQDSDIDVSGPLGRSLQASGIGRTGSAKFDNGYVGVLSLGYGFGNGFRTELEGNFRQNNVDSISGFGGLGRVGSSGGHQNTYGVMANAFYDFNVGDLFGTGIAVTPYIGAGVGYAWTNWNGVRFSTPTTRTVIDDTDGQFAYQGIAGAAFPIAAVPGLSLTAEYRFFGTLSPEMDVRTTSFPSGVSTRGKAEVENLNHSFLVGLRYAFNPPASPAPVVVAPAPAAAPAPARTYLVFFDFDRADLTDRARQIITDAAQNSRRMQVTRIEVSGHADRSGTPQYNQRLSQRRAEAVATELTRQGVSREQIMVQAFGESRPLVPTADGAREPQNRRVEIVLR